MVVTPSEDLSNTSAKSCAEGLRKDGYSLVGRVLSENTVGLLMKEFDRRYSHLLLPGAEFRGIHKTGNRRYMLTVELSGPFGELCVYANQAIMDILSIAFDREFVLESFGIVLSLPGAKTQHVHRDGPRLFGSALDAVVPIFAVTVGIPLVDMNLEHGTTEVFPGSHRFTEWKESSPSIIPDVPAGSGIMWDFRTLHRGTENRSNAYRPLLYMTYSRPWWRDTGNFEVDWSDSGPVTRQKKVAAGKDFFKSVPPETRFLFGNLDAP